MPPEPDAGADVHDTDTGAAARTQSRAERDAADRASILAGWEDELPAERGAATARQAPKPAAPAPKAAAAAPEELDSPEVDDDELELDDPDEGPGDDNEPVDVAPAGGPDAETARRLEQVSKADKRNRVRLAAERSSFEREREAFVSEWKPKIAEYEQFKQLKARGSSDPIAMAEAFGYGEDDLEELSKIFHGYSKAAASDPKWKDYARKLQQERGTRRELAELRASHEKLTSDLARERDEREQTSRRDEYLGRVARAANDSTPLLKKDLELRGATAREALRRIALAMAERDGDTPDPRKVAAAYERRRRSGLERDKGLYDFLKAPAPGAAKPADRRSAIAVVDRTRAAPAESAPKRGSLIPSRDEFLRKMLDDKLDD